MTFDQVDFDVRCEWGELGAKHLAPSSDVAMVVDVLSFSTCVDIAASRGATVIPYRWKDSTADEFAERHGAILAAARGAREFSLSPASLLDIPVDTALVLPSPNGASISLYCRTAKCVIAACLRNARASATFAASVGKRVAVIPAGERWHDGSLRPCYEDWISAGAIIHHLPGSK